MADTQRTLAALQALLPDNTSGDISPQDVRDFLVSASPNYGALSLSVAAATAIAVPGTFVKAAGTTVAGLLKNYTMPANNRLTDGGAVARLARVQADISATVAVVNQETRFRLAVNGITDPTTEQRRFFPTIANPGSISVSGLLLLNPADFVEVWVTNQTAANAVTAVSLTLSIVDFVV